MSLNGSGNPLLIELRASRQYKFLVLIPHLLTLLLVMVLAWGEPLLLLSIPLVLFSLNKSQRDYRANSAWRYVKCFSDGRVERLEEAGGKIGYQLLHAPFILPWIIILPLDFGGRRRWFPVLPDALSHEQWLALRLFLRYSLD